MLFNAWAMAHITKRYYNGMLTTWEQLMHHIEDAAYQGYNHYMLTPKESQYIHTLGEYGFEIIYNEITQQYVARWNV